MNVLSAARIELKFEYLRETQKKHRIFWRYDSIVCILGALDVHNQNFSNMKTLKMSLSLMCLLMTALLLVLVGSHTHQTSQAASLEGCIACIVCEGRDGHKMACCMGLSECGDMGESYSCDGFVFNCDGDILDEPD